MWPFAFLAAALAAPKLASEAACAEGILPSEACAAAAVADAERAVKRKKPDVALDALEGRWRPGVACTWMPAFPPWAEVTPAQLDGKWPILAAAARDDALRDRAFQAWREACERYRAPGEAESKEVRALDARAAAVKGPADLDEVLRGVRVLPYAPTLALRARLRAAVEPHLPAWLEAQKGGMQEGHYRALQDLGLATPEMGRPFQEARAAAAVARREAETRRVAGASAALAAEVDALVDAAPVPATYDVVERALAVRKRAEAEGTAEQVARIDAAVVASVDLALAAADARPDYVGRLGGYATVIGAVPIGAPKEFARMLTDRVRARAAAATEAELPALRERFAAAPIATAVAIAGDARRLIRAAGAPQPALDALASLLGEAAAAARARVGKRSDLVGRSRLWEGIAAWFVGAEPPAAWSPVSHAGLLDYAAGTGESCSLPYRKSLSGPTLRVPDARMTLRVTGCTLRESARKVGEHRVTGTNAAELDYSTCGSRNSVGNCTSWALVGGGRYDFMEDTMEYTAHAEYAAELVVTWRGGTWRRPLTVSRSLVMNDDLHVVPWRERIGKEMASALHEAAAAAVREPGLKDAVRTTAEAWLSAGDRERAADPDVALDRYALAAFAGATLGEERLAWIGAQVGAPAERVPALLSLAHR